jgi:hypothetical protein
LLHGAGLTIDITLRATLGGVYTPQYALVILTEVVIFNP